jgi:type IV pilus assembly protein PilX
MREVTLETRITANVMEQKRLVNDAESGLRDAEKRLLQVSRAAEQCSLTESFICIQPDTPAYAPDFSNAREYAGIDNSTGMDRKVYWYVLDAPAGEAEGESENPEYGNRQRGLGTFYYEVNSQAFDGTDDAPRERCTFGVTCLRSVIARVFND